MLIILISLSLFILSQQLSPGSIKEKQIAVKTIEKRFPHPNLKKILQKMEEEKLVEKKGAILRIPH